MQVLASAGCMEAATLVSGNAAVPDRVRLEGLIIDDHFTLEARRRDDMQQSGWGSRVMDAASKEYVKVGLAEAAGKSIREASVAAVAGAEIDGDQCTVGAPVKRRLALATISLRSAKLPVI
eukprot:5313750-Heterocapsa_arctica.AAC.1